MTLADSCESELMNFHSAAEVRLHTFLAAFADTNGIPITTNNADDQWYITVILYPSESLPSGI